MSQIQASGDARRQRAGRAEPAYAVETIAGAAQMEESPSLPPDKRRMAGDLIGAYATVAKIDMMR